MQKLSIVTVCYNDFDLEITCKSIIEQTWQDFEWVVIDGGSNEQIQKLWDKYKYRIDKFISEPDKGIYDAYNKGVLNASGEFLHFLNAGDSYYDKNTLETIFKDSHYKGDVLYGDTVFMYNDNSQESEIIHNPKFLDKNYFESRNIQTSSTFIKRDLFDKFGLFNLKYKIAADTEKIILLHKNNIQFEYLPVIVSLFDRSGISNNPKTIEQCYAEYYEILDKFFPNRNKEEKITPKLSKWYYNIFSLTNLYKDDKKYKVITFLGIQIKIRCKKYVAVKPNPKQDILTKNGAAQHILKNPNLKVGENTFLLSNTTFRYDVNSKNKITIGQNSMVNCNFIFESDQGEVEIGDRTFINASTELISRNKIKIGNDVTIAWGCTLYDHNSHSIDWKNRRKDLEQQIEDYKNGINYIHNKDWTTVKSRPITIEDKAWIGFGCTILNGVTIGEGAIVGAKSVVRENVEPWTIVTGNPAKFIKRIQHD